MQGSMQYFLRKKQCLLQHTSPCEVIALPLLPPFAHTPLEPCFVRLSVSKRKFLFDFCQY